MALPHGTTGSLRPTFVSARAVALAVKQACTFALYDRLPTGLSLPLHSSVTLLEETAPVKLTTSHGSLTGFTVKGETTNANRVVFHRWLPAGRNRRINASHLSYAVFTRRQYQAIVKVHGVFPSCCG
jgi:hypothetical protein